MSKPESHIRTPEAVQRRLDKEKRVSKIYISSIDNREIRHTWPNLFETPAGLFAKYNELSGEVCLSSFKETDLTRSRIDRTKDEIVSGRNIQTPAQVVRINLSVHKDIETTIRKADHVYDRYEPERGSAVRRTNGLIDLANELLVEFDRGVDEERLEELAHMVDERLYVLNMDRVRKEILEKIRGQIQSGVHKDSLDRLNQLASRMKIASAWLKAIQESFFNSKVEDKYARAKFVLMQEREIERFYLQRALIYSERLYDLDPQDPDFVAQWNELRDFSRQFLIPTSIKVAPYRMPALLFTDSVFGFGEMMVNYTARTKEQKGSLELADAIYSTPQEDRKGRLLKGAILLRLALDQGEENLYKSDKI